MKIYSYAELKKRHRQEGADFPRPVALRVHRALSWLDCAEQASSLDEKFLFLWISSNSAYAADLDSDADYETKRFDTFPMRVVSRLKKASMATIFRKRYPGPVCLLLDNQFAFKPFWDRQNSLIPDEQWTLHFKTEESTANRALASQKTHKVLQLLFHRLYALRNQLIHCGVAWGGEVNRSQIQNDSALLGEIVPLVTEIMVDNAPEDSIVPIYPVQLNFTHSKISEELG